MKIRSTKLSIRNRSSFTALAIALVAAPLLALAGESGRDSDAGRPSQDTTTVSIPLTGTGVAKNEHEAKKPRPKDVQAPDDESRGSSKTVDGGRVDKDGGSKPRPRD